MNLQQKHLLLSIFMGTSSLKSLGTAEDTQSGEGVPLLQTKPSIIQSLSLSVTLQFKPGGNSTKPAIEEFIYTNFNTTFIFNLK